MILSCIKIFLSRILDVSLGVLRTMYVVKGSKILSSLIAFFEVLIWFYAARIAIVNCEGSLVIAIFYALGYAVGTFLGTIINEVLINGYINIQVITNDMKMSDILYIRNKGYGLTVTKSIDNKYIINITVSKKKYKNCLSLIKTVDNKAFIIINDAKVIVNGFF